MLIHANTGPRIPSGFCCVGSASAAGRAAVRGWRIAGRGGAAVGRDDGRRESLVSDLARRGAGGAESGPGGPQAAARARRIAEPRTRAAGRPRGAWVHDGVVDVAARRRADQAPHGGRASSGPRLARAAGLGLVAPAPDARTRQRVRAGSRHAPCAAASGLCARPVSTTLGLRVPAPRGVALLTWSLIYSARFISQWCATRHLPTWDAAAPFY